MIFLFSFEKKLFKSQILGCRTEKNVVQTNKLLDLAELLA